MMMAPTSKKPLISPDQRRWSSYNAELFILTHVVGLDTKCKVAVRGRI